MENSELTHWGVKGMKWGVRRYQNKDGTLTVAGAKRYGVENSRILKKGTEIQNISKRELSSENKKSNRIYAAYTDADKASYVDTMANYEYDGKGYKNTFKVAKDITIASEREIVRTISEMFKENPKNVSDMMMKANNDVNFLKKNKKFFEKKLSKLSEAPETDKSLQLARRFIQTVPMSGKASSLANDFYTRMIAKGFDAVIDTNDAYATFDSSQDPLVIFNMEKLGKVESVKLTKKDLDAMYEYVGSKEFKKKNKDASQIVHSIQLKRRGAYG